MTHTAIAIGSNIGDPKQNVQEAIRHLAELGQLMAQSSLYCTKPWGVLDQPDFINAVVIIDVAGTPQQLLEQLMAIEKSMGRDRATGLRWGPRLIDLDILTFGDLCIDEPDLTVPHKHMHERAFVLAPLSEIDPRYAQAFANLDATSRAEITRLTA